MSPYFSVIITTYNRAELLKRALHSLVNQTEQNWEAVIIDDGSTDETETVVKHFLNEKIRYFEQKNKGCAQAKNAGIQLAKCKFITFLDSDDEYKTNHLQSRKEILEADAEIELLHGGVEIIGNEYVPDRHNPKELIHLSECVIGGTFFIKREIMLALNGFNDILLGEDADLFERAMQEKVKIMKTDIPSYIYHRTDNDSITHKLVK